MNTIVRFLTRLKKRLHAKKYVHIIPLGFNCEVAFRFYHYYKFLDSSLFAWTYSNSINDLIYALNNFNLILSKKILDPTPLYECECTHIYFHGKLDMKLWLNGDGNKNLMNEDKKELIERVNYLKEKFNKCATDDKKTLYIYKVSENDSVHENINENIIKLYDTLKKLCTNPMDLLIIIEEDYAYKFLEEREHLYIRSVKKFNPEEDVVNPKKGDKFGWQMIFDEFRPLYKLKKEKQFKFEDKR